mgnify:CR=1 FL=1
MPAFGKRPLGKALTSGTRRVTSTSTVPLPVAVPVILAEGFTIDDFKRVIDNKCSDWLGNEKMEEFLRPNTLFAPSHFEEYLNQGKREVEKPIEEHKPLNLWDEE